VSPRPASAINVVAVFEINMFMIVLRWTCVGLIVNEQFFRSVIPINQPIIGIGGVGVSAVRESLDVSISSDGFAVVRITSSAIKDTFRF
jgi:hypothetical protein